MPTHIHLANLIINKKSIKERYKGGIEQFRLDYINQDQELNQEDNELFSISRMNASEFDIQKLTEQGLEFNIEKNCSDDFTILTRYDGSLWKVDWLESNQVFAWHVECEQEIIEKAKRFSEITVKELSEVIDGNDNFLSAIV